MATAYTSLLGLALPVTGELSGAWGDVVNDSITSLLDSAISGTTSLTTDADVTLTTTTGAANQARQAIILWNPASGTTTRNITAPAQSKIYTVINASGGTQSIVFRGAGPTTGVTIIKGESAQVAWNGSDFAKISSSAGDVTVRNITVSGSATLSAGTANGVAYLNGSKVLTTGSALTFDAGASGEFALTRASSAFFKTTETGGTVTSYFGSFSGLSYIGTTTNHPVAFYVNSAEQMRLTSTGLGIGTSSPAGKLSVRTTGAQVDISTSATDLTFEAIDRAATGNSIDTKFYTRNGTFQWYNGAYTERMRLNAAGNLGLGVTPSANDYTGAAQFQWVGHSITPRSVDNFAMSMNAYHSGGGWKYGNTASASLYVQAAGQHVWSTSPSGTAGNAISFTQAMTLVGTSTPALLVGTTSDFGGFNFQAKNQVGFSVHNSADNATAAYFSAANNVTLTSAGSSAVINGVDGILLGVSGTERARIDSNGQLLLNNTGGAGFSARVVSVGAVNNDAFAGEVPSGSTGGGTCYVGKISNTTAFLAYWLYGSSNVGTITSNGSTTAYNTSSDYRLKEDIQPMTGALAKVQQLKPCTYKWKVDGSDGEGFIAHELQSVVPDAVTGEKDAVNEDGSIKPQGIDTSFLVATLTAAIQEQQALIQTLTARVAALESN